MYLYELTAGDAGSRKSFVVGNGSGRYSDKFSMVEPETATITKGRISINWRSRSVSLIFDENIDAFAVAGHFFVPKDISVSKY